MGRINNRPLISIYRGCLGQKELGYNQATQSDNGFVCYIVAGFVHNWILCLAIGIVLTVGVLLILRARSRSDTAAA